MAGLGTLEWVKQPKDPDNPIDFAYLAKDKRGVEFGLIRNAKNPEMLFAVNLKTMKTLSGWFTDAGGEVRNR